VLAEQCRREAELEDAVALRFAFEQAVARQGKQRNGLRQAGKLVEERVLRGLGVRFANFLILYQGYAPNACRTCARNCATFTLASPPPSVSIGT
jgi:hypothetical protein